MIKNIVIGSGAYDLFIFAGMLDKLIKTEYIKLENIENVYGTSAGAIILFVIAAKAKWTEFIKYITNKPWDRYIEDSTTRGLLNIYNNKGVFNLGIMEDALIPIFKSVGLKRTVTFKELYEHSGIKYNIYALNLNIFKAECFNYENTPDLEVLKGIYMSSSFPILFSPLYYNESYYLDGGIHIDCPIDECLENNNEDEIICIRKLCPIRPLKLKLLKGSSLLDFAMLFISKLTANTRKMDDLKFKNSIITYGEELLLSDLIKIISEKEKRIEKLETGRDLSEKYLIKKLKNSVDELA
jgi:predicted acylesterase/phospholipase RssA